jgi:hypothetical protein
VDGEEVRLGVDLVRALGAVDAHLAVAVGPDVRVVGEHAHAEPLRALGDELADAPEAEHAERLVHQLDARVLRAVPAAGDEAGVGLRDVAREREQQAERVLGGRHDVRLRRVGDDDAALGRGGDVDVVDADARAADDLQPVGARDQLRGDLRRAAHDERVVLADALGDLPVDADVDVEVLLEQVDAAGADVLRDQDPHAVFSTTKSMHAVSARTSSGSMAGNIPTRSWLRPSLR